MRTSPAHALVGFSPARVHTAAITHARVRGVPKINSQTRATTVMLSAVSGLDAVIC